MLSVTFVLILTFLTAAVTPLVTPPLASASAARGGADIGGCRRLARNLLPPPPPPHFLHVVTRCKSRNYGASLETEYPIATVGYEMVVCCLNIHPIKQLLIRCANDCRSTYPLIMVEVVVGVR